MYVKVNHPFIAIQNFVPGMADHVDARPALGVPARAVVEHGVLMSASPQPRAPPPARTRACGGSEGGVVLVWLALMMVVLLGMGALGIDVAHLSR